MCEKDEEGSRRKETRLPTGAEGQGRGRRCVATESEQEAKGNTDNMQATFGMSRGGERELNACNEQKKYV